ncbi:MAG: DUF6134 family protein [Gammaproteobacteria bacterium]|nr:DUF6134 family protein [Gammaproteobacteria bacterium]
MALKRRSMVLGLGVIGSGMLPLPSVACRLFPPDSTDRYRARQEDRDAGFQSISFFRESGEFVVSTRRNFRYVDVEGAAVDYDHSSREVWVNGWLNRFESTTRHGERTFRVDAETVDHVTMLVRSSAYPVPSLVTGYVIPGNVWHRDSRLVNRLMDMVDGRLKLVRVRYVGKEALAGAGDLQVANHYQWRGEINLDAWYTEECQLSRMLLPFKRAEPVIFDLV